MSTEEADMLSTGFLPDDSMLKPRLEIIFAEVEKSLPSIDFEVSDISSEEDEIPVFQREPMTSLEIDGNILEDHTYHKDSSLDDLDLVKDNGSGSSGREPEPSFNAASLMMKELGIRDNKSHSKERNIDRGETQIEVGNIGDGRLHNLPSKVNTWMYDKQAADTDDLELQLRDDNDYDTDIFSTELESSICHGESVDRRLMSTSWEKQGKVILPIRQQIKKIRVTENTERLVSMYIPQRAPVLNLDSLDVDTLLEQTSDKSFGSYNKQTVVESHNNIEGGDADGGPSLIERLAALSMVQSGTKLGDVDPETGALRKGNKDFRLPEQKQRKTAINSAVAVEGRNQTASIGTNTSDLSNLPRSSLSNPAKPTGSIETVHLDLRRFDQTLEEQQQSVAAVRRVLKITPEDEHDSSSSDSDDDVDLWQEQRRKIKESLSKSGSLPPDFEKPSFYRKTASPVATPKLQTHAQKLAGHLPDKTKPANVSSWSEIPRDRLAEISRDRPAEISREQHVEIKQKQPLEKAAAHVDETGKCGDHVIKATRDVTEDSQKQKKIDLAKRRREKKEQQTKSRVRLGQRLDGVRPHMSDTGRQVAAQATDTVFDIEASYEPPPLTLPSDLPGDLECLLLIIRLSANGEVIPTRTSNVKNVDPPGISMSATYTVLLSWLLSLVPANFDFMSGRPGQTPTSAEQFYVIGLQQLYLDGQLCLYVAVTPNEQFLARESPAKLRTKAKRRDSGKSIRPFQQWMTSFLSHNSLLSLCEWLEYVSPAEVRSDHANPDIQTEASSHPLYVYKSALPRITTKSLATYIQLNPDPKAVQKIFGMGVGFFWETVDSGELRFDQDFKDEEVDYDTQKTMSLVYKHVYRKPESTMGILLRVLQEGLDLAGVRLLYPTLHLMNVASGSPGSLPNLDSEDSKQMSEQDILNNIGPVLALALRGSYARSTWLDSVGPADPALAKKTDPNSLCALFGGESRQGCLLFCPRNPSRIMSELARWFGGRVPPSGVIEVGRTKRHRQPSGSKKSKKSSRVDMSEAENDLLCHTPPATLTATTRSHVFVAISPLVPCRALGAFFITCHKRGFQLRGVRRIKLTNKKATSLGISSNVLGAFVAGEETMKSASKSASGDSTAQLNTTTVSGPTTLLLLERENALHLTSSLIERFMVQLCLRQFLGTMETKLGIAMTTDLLFHYAPFTDLLLNMLGGDFGKVPETELSSIPGYIYPRLHSNPEMEQVAVVTLTGHQQLKTVGYLLGHLQALTVVRGRLPITDSFELLGIKCLSKLGLQHAKDITPYEVGDRGWKQSIRTLTSGPAVVMVLRGVNAFKRLESILHPKPAHALVHKVLSLDKILSPSAELAYQQASHFFQDKELFPDCDSRPLLPYLPPFRHVKIDTQDRVKKPKYGKFGRTEVSSETSPEESVLQTMLSGPRQLTTVLVVKPHTVHKHLAKLLKRVALEGFRVVAGRLRVLSPEEAGALVPEEDANNEVLRQMHIDYLTVEGACLVLCLQRENAVKKLLDVLGPDDPRQAKQQNRFLWRAVFGTDALANGLYGSRDYSSAVREQKMFFPTGLCCSETIDLMAEQIACPEVDFTVSFQAAKERDVVFSDPSVSQDQQPTTGYKNSGTSTVRPPPVVTLLTQTNCIVLTPPLLHPEGRSRRMPYVEIVDHLLSHGFELVGCRMIWMMAQQAEQYLCLCKYGNFTLVPVLKAGPVLVLAIQRDNAVMAFDSLLGSEYEKDSIFAKYSQKILRPKNVEQANKHLAFFFDKLMPGAHAQIVPRQDD